jgi:DNA-binding winged helix-turn-helix (wHTH) protein
MYAMTSVPRSLSEATQLQPHGRLTTRSLRDDEIRAVADATYRGDNPLRFESVRQAALLFERVGYTITRDPQVSALALPPQPIAVGGLAVDPIRRSVHLDGREIELNTREFDLLTLLARHPGQVFTRAQLLDLIWPRDFDGADRTVDVLVARLRHKLGESRHSQRLVLTVQGVGYKLAVPRVSNVASGIS